MFYLSKQYKEFLFDIGFYLILIIGVIKYNAIITISFITYLFIVGYVVGLFFSNEKISQSVMLSNCKEYTPYFVGGYILIVHILTGSYIPSSSMRPTLTASEYVYILNKYHIKEPITNTILFSFSKPQIGDVVTFNYPKDQTQIYIKRIIATEGDTISYINKQLMINNKLISQTYQKPYQFTIENSHQTLSIDRYSETINHVTHDILLDKSRPVYSLINIDPTFLEKGYCHYFNQGFTCKVPKNKYFVMGDNRDYSSDSRYWGFVDIHQIKGKAIISMMSYDNQSLSFFNLIK